MYINAHFSEISLKYETLIFKAFYIDSIRCLLFLVFFYFLSENSLRGYCVHATRSKVLTVHY